MQNIIYNHYYKGYSLYQGEKSDQGFYINILERSINLFESKLKKHSQVLVIRLDIHFPQDMQAENNNNKFQYFIEEYSRYLRNNGFEPSYLWCKEKNSNSANFHYHLFFLLNGNKMRYLKYLSKANEIWARSLQLPHPVEGLIYCPQNNQIMVKRGDLETINTVIERLSYLAKVYSKEIDRDTNGRSWGSSRIY